MSHLGAADDGTHDGDLTILLHAYAQGDQQALHLLIDRVYTELRRIAAGRLRGENHNPLMGPTALVNEAYIRLVGGKDPTEWVNRRHFFAAASETMRRILVDQARQRLTSKRGGAAVRTMMDEVAITVDLPDDELLDLDAALQALAKSEPDKAELVKLRFFVGLSENEAADTLGISRATASRHWTYARAWLFNRLKPREPDLASEDEKLKNREAPGMEITPGNAVTIEYRSADCDRNEKTGRDLLAGDATA
jgi:RNA polymerase sigma factor (TIGR02999 family)